MLVSCLMVDILERANDMQKSMKRNAKEKKKLKAKEKSKGRKKDNEEVLVSIGINPMVPL